VNKPSTTDPNPVKEAQRRIQDAVAAAGTRRAHRVKTLRAMSERLAREGRDDLAAHINRLADEEAGRVPFVDVHCPVCGAICQPGEILGHVGSEECEENVAEIDRTLANV
jgi:hypothetical protein